MRCNNCIHYDVCYQYDIIGEDDNEMCALYEQKRPHEEWEACLDTEYCKCSYCGTVVMLEESVRFHFCPTCGADMREGDEK